MNIEGVMGKYKNLALNTGLFAANAFATRLISFILVPIYTSYMSAGEYGLIDMSLTVISLITPLLTLSVADAALRFIVEDSAHDNEYIGISILITAASVFAVLAVSPILDNGIFGGLGDYKGWFVLAYATNAFFTLFGSISRSLGLIKIIPVSAFLSSLVTLLSALITVGNLSLGIIGYFISVSVGPIAGIILYLRVGSLGKRMISGIRLTVRGGVVTAINLSRPMLKYALPLVPNGIFWWAQTSLSRFFITGMLGISASGMYAAASKIPNLINTAYTIFQQAWQLSAFQEYHNKGIASFYSIIFNLLQAIMSIFCGLLSFLSPFLAFILLRGETFNSWPMIAILLVASLVNVLNGFLGTVYTSTMHTDEIMKTTVVGALLCVILTPALMVPMGLFGACAASVLSQMAVFVIRAIDSRKYIAFDMKLRVLISVLILLSIQAVTTAFQLSRWRVISGVCLLLVILIETWSVVNGFKSLLSNEIGLGWKRDR